MATVDGWFARARSVFRRTVAERRMDEEFRFHLEMERDKLIRQGVPPDEARRRAQIAFGGVDRHREEMRDGRGTRWLSDLTADVRFALRMLRRSPLFAIAAAVTIALGVGLNGMVVSVVNGLMFRPLPVADPQQLVGIFTIHERTGGIQHLSYDDYVDLRDKSGVFAGVAVQGEIPLNLVARESAEMVWGQMVSENFFSVLGMQPALGRFFSGTDSRTSHEAVAVLSYPSWKDRFHGDSSVIGRTVLINGSRFTIIGVAAKGFKGVRTFAFWPEIWTPLGMHEVLVPQQKGWVEGRGFGDLIAVGRMHAGWTKERTERAASRFAKQLAQSYPKTNENMSIMLVAGKNGFDNPAFVPPKLLVLGTSLSTFGVTLVLIVICANLANLLLSRTAAREQELAIRLSLGCSRARLVRQLLVEVVVLALPGVLLGMSAAFAAPAVQRRMLPKLQFRVGFDVTPDWHVMLYTAGAAALAVLLVGLSPALRATRPALVPALKSVIGARGASRGGRKGAGMRAALVVVQLALSVVLVVCGSLFVRSLVAARAVDVGFGAKDRIVISVNPGLQNYEEGRARAFYRTVVDRARALPGVAGAGWGFPVPFDSYGRGIAVHVDGLVTNSRDQMVGVSSSTVDVGFLEALAIPVVAGRSFAVEDSLGAPRRMVVSRTAAAKFWPGKDAIGKHVRLNTIDGPEIVVVGVVADAKFNTVGGAPEARVYLPLQQNYTDWLTLVVHAGGPPEATIRKLREVIASADPALPPFGALTIEDGIVSSLNAAESAATFAGMFGLVALVIATTGLYALVANAVQSRTREIGVRVALGATPRNVLALVIGGAGRVSVVGLLLGIVVAAAVARLLGALLYGISSYDLVTFVAVPAVLAVVVIVASYVPARRATRLDAAAALRE